MGQRANELADRFEAGVAEFRKTIESLSDADWAAVCDDEGWTVGQAAQHVSGQFPLEMEFITASAEGRPLPSYTWADINEKNDTRAAKNAAAQKAAVLDELRTGSKWAADYVRALTDEQLDRAAPLGLADGADVTTQQLIEGGVLIAHVTGHLESIRAATMASARSS